MAEVSDLSSYERQREDRIKRNKEVLIQMGILTAASALNEAVSGTRTPVSAAKPTKRLRKLSSELAVDAEPARRSSRLRGEAPTAQCIRSQENCRHVRRSLQALARRISTLTLQSSARHLPRAD